MSTKSATEFAFDNDLSKMTNAIENNLKEKLIVAMEQKRIEIASAILHNDNMSEGLADDLLSVAKKVNPNAKMGDSVEKQKADRDELFAKRKEKADQDKKEGKVNIPPKYPDSYPLGGRDEKSGRSYSEEIEEAKLISPEENKKARTIADKINAKREVQRENNKANAKKQQEKKNCCEGTLEETLSVEDGAAKWVSDFVNSDDPRFEGKSKDERRNQALAAFYSAKKKV